MSEEVILDAISSHIDEFSSLTYWLIPISIIVFVSALNPGKREVQILSVKVSRSQATIFTDTIVAFYAVAALKIIWRLHALFHHLSSEKYVTEAFTLVVTHSWIFNPFSFFGSHWRPLAYLSTVFIVVFYVFCNDLGSLLRGNLDDPKTELEKFDFYITGFNFLMGCVIAGSMYSFYRLMSEKLESFAPNLARDIISYTNLWRVVVLITIFLAVSFDFFVMHFIQKNIDKDASMPDQ